MLVVLVKLLLCLKLRLYVGRDGFCSSMDDLNLSLSFFIIKAKIFGCLFPDRQPSFIM